MSNEIKLSGGQTGVVIYAVIERADAQIWRVDTSVFEAYNSASWASYALTLTEQTGSGRYRADFPTGISAAGVYAVAVRQRAGASAALTDLGVGSGAFEWSGTNEVLIQSRADKADYTTTRATKLDYLDAAVSSRNAVAPDNASVTAIKAKTDTIPVSPAAVGSAMALVAAEHTAIVTDTQTALTNQGYTTTRAPFLDTLNGLVAAIWGATARTLTAFGFTVNTNANTVETGMAADYARRTGDYATSTNVTAAQGVITTAITAKAVTPVTDVAAALVAYNTARVSDVAVTISSSLTTPQATQLTQAAADAAATIARLAAQVPGTAAVVVLPAPTATGKRLVRVDLTAWGVGSDSVASVAVSVMLSLPIGVIAAKVGAEYVVSGQMWKKLTDSVGIADFELLPTSAMLPTGATYEFAVGDQAFCKVALPAGASVSLTDLV